MNRNNTTFPLHLCILGHSGAGKSQLSQLFPIPGWDPYRVRKPRDENDKAMSRNDFDKLLVNGEVEVADKKWKRGSLLWPGPKKNRKTDKGKVIRDIYENDGICVCEYWTFLKVRKDDQCLKHDEFKSNESMRIEIFAPQLLNMIKNSKKLPMEIRLEKKNLLVVILNPTCESFSNMTEPSKELCIATTMAVMERKRAKGEVPDLADALKRVEYLKGELKAWREFLKMNTVTTIECLDWPHFEYRYNTDPQEELERARQSIFKAVQSMSKVWTLEEVQKWVGRIELSCMLQ